MYPWILIDAKELYLKFDYQPTEKEKGRERYTWEATATVANKKSALKLYLEMIGVNGITARNNEQGITR